MTDKVIETTQAKQVTRYHIHSGEPLKYTGEFVLASDYERLQAEVERLRAGNLTPEEFQALCHNLPEDCTAEAFCKGCEDYQAKLFGQSPIAALRDRAVAAEARAEDLSGWYKKGKQLLTDFAALWLKRVGSKLEAPQTHIPDILFVLDGELRDAWEAQQSSLQSSESARQAAEAKARELAKAIFDEIAIATVAPNDGWRQPSCHEVSAVVSVLVRQGFVEREPSGFNWYRLLPQESEAPQ